MRHHDNPPRRNRNGPVIRERRNGASSATPRQKYESYLARAREAQLVGDVIEMENCYQHAEHYLRLTKAGEVGT
jgi:hypothetical protein